MRIDKYLWCVRYYKTRNMATAACRKGQVRINDIVVKPSREVYPADTIQLRLNQVNYTLKVKDIPPSRVGAKLVDIYRADITPKKEFDTLEMFKFSRDSFRKKGTGRPTKKDRRDIDDFNLEKD